MASKLTRTLRLIWASILVSCMFSCSMPDTYLVNYIVPEGHEGFVLVIFGQEDGIELKPVTGVVDISVPTDGVLKVKSSKWKSLTIEYRYYYADGSGNRIQLPYLLPQGSPKNNEESLTEENLSESQKTSTIFVMNLRNVTFQTTSGPAHAQGFVIGKPKDALANFMKMEDFIDQYSNP